MIPGSGALAAASALAFVLELRRRSSREDQEELVVADIDLVVAPNGLSLRGTFQ